MADEQEHGNDQDHHSAIKTFENVELAFFLTIWIFMFVQTNYSIWGPNLSLSILSFLVSPLYTTLFFHHKTDKKKLLTWIREDFKGESFNVQWLTQIHSFFYKERGEESERWFENVRVRPGNICTLFPKVNYGGVHHQTTGGNTTDSLLRIKLQFQP